MQEYFDRIDLNTDLSNISKIICEKYNLGNYLSDKIVEIGYEDFNYILTTSKNKYFVKILYNGRDENEANDYLERLSSVCATDISFPKLLSANGEYLFKIKMAATLCSHFFISLLLIVILLCYKNQVRLYVLGLALSCLRYI